MVAVEPRRATHLIWDFDRRAIDRVIEDKVELPQQNINYAIKPTFSLTLKEGFNNMRTSQWPRLQ